jgi:transcriptional regulator with XRE-family HTH domain
MNKRVPDHAERISIETADALVAIGNRIRERRSQKALTLQALSELTGLSPSMLSLVERGQTSPSIGTLVVISSALGVHMSDLLAVDDRAARDPVSRVPEQPIYETARGVLRRILREDRIRGVEVAINEYAPDTGSAEQPVHHAGYEYGVVLEGELTVEVDGLAYVLRSGDLISYDSSRAHRIWNHAPSAYGRSGSTWSAPDAASGWRHRRSRAAPARVAGAWRSRSLRRGGRDLLRPDLAIDAQDVLAPAQFGAHGQNGRGAGGDGERERVPGRAAFGETERHRAHEAVARADRAPRPDFGRAQPVAVTAGGQQRAIGAETHGHDLGAAARDQLAGRLVLLGGLPERPTDRGLELAQIRLDQVHPRFERALERLARGVEHEAGTPLGGDARDLRVEVLGHAARQTAARYQVIVIHDLELAQAGLPFLGVDLRPLGHENDIPARSRARTRCARSACRR